MTSFNGLALGTAANLVKGYAPDWNPEGWKPQSRKTWPWKPKPAAEDVVEDTPRKAMNRALQAMLTEHLRSRGFKGSLPHLRRYDDGQVCLMTFQFYSVGGRFAVNVATCSLDGILQYDGTRIPANRATAYHVLCPGERIGSLTFPYGDHWFWFGPRNYDPNHLALQSPEYYRNIADDVVRAIDRDAEPFWAHLQTLRDKGCTDDDLAREWHEELYGKR